MSKLEYMLSALLSGISASVVTYWIGTRYFGFGLLDCVWAIVASNVAGYVALLLTLALERKPAIRRVIMGGALRTWAVLAVLYTGFMIALDPTLRSPGVLLALIAPLIWTTGLMLPLWGPTQDRVLRWEHARLKKRALYTHKQQFARPEGDVIRVES